MAHVFRTNVRNYRKLILNITETVVSCHKLSSVIRKLSRNISVYTKLKIGVWFSKIGVCFIKIGVWLSKIGVCFTKIGVSFSKIVVIGVGSNFGPRL